MATNWDNYIQNRTFRQKEEPSQGVHSRHHLVPRRWNRPRWSMTRLSSEIVSFMDSFFLYFPESSLDIWRSLKTYPKTHLTHTWHSQPVEGFDLKTVFFNVGFPKKSMCHLDGCCVLCYFFFWGLISNSIPKTIPSPRILQVRVFSSCRIFKLTSEKNRDFLIILGTFRLVNHHNLPKW